ncbi:hypothetical protein AB4305_15950 [Nocardia sp. 2YAB30]|uniref:hypothetical protein n=1 Tax=unclassified Nocardia TaxID=2637762 RepID=UPI003F983083
MTLITTLGTAVIAPLFALLTKLLFAERDTGRTKTIKRLARLIEAVPEDQRSLLKRLLDSEIERYTRHQMRRSSRRLNGGNLFALIFFGAITSLLAWGGILLAINVNGWVFGILTAIVLVFGVFMTITSGTLLYEYPGDPPSGDSTNT